MKKGLSETVLCRGRHERTRARTRERALLTLQQLADAVGAPQPGAASRMRYAFSVAAPYSGVLRRELGEQLVSCGMIGAAMSLFQELELWDNLILCYQLLQKKPQVGSGLRMPVRTSLKVVGALCGLQGAICSMQSRYLVKALPNVCTR